MQSRLLGLKQSKVLTCANSSVEVVEPDLCLSVEIFFRVISQREMEELEMTMDQVGTSRQTIKTLLVKEHGLEIENLTLNIFFYCSSFNCKIGKYSILHNTPSNQLIFFICLANYSLLLFSIQENFYQFRN